MRIDILTIFPEMLDGVIENSIIKRASAKGIIDIFVHDFRNFAENKHKKVDDTPYGGGAGMLLTLQPIIDCLKSIPDYQKAHIILTSASGNQYNQQKAQSLASKDHVIIICGHYEGIDERIVYYITEEISLGDYILTSGEVASLVIVDSVIRLLPNAIKPTSVIEESFSESLLEYPQYTKPAIFDNISVPDILLSGNHEEIRKYRRYKSLEKTFIRRPDLLEKHVLTREDSIMLDKIKKEKS